MLNETPPPFGTVLEAQKLFIGYKEGPALRYVAKDLRLRLHAGEMVCLLGPNGVGKSTLMRTLAGLQPPLSGNVKLLGEQLSRYSRKEIAKQLALVLTEKVPTGSLKVSELLSLGRYPYLGWLGILSERDKAVVKNAIESTQLHPFLDQPLQKLSDGEQQKVMIARALVQDTALILLDEPTAHLDLPNRVTVMRLLRQMALQHKKAIVVATHELDLALQAADTLWLMMPNQQMLVGTPEDLVLSGAFEDAFKKSGFDFDRNTGNFKVNAPDPRKTIGLKGGQPQYFWTKRALEREGYTVQENELNNRKIVANEHFWQLKWENKASEHRTIADLVCSLRSLEHEG